MNTVRIKTRVIMDVIKENVYYYGKRGMYRVMLFKKMFDNALDPLGKPWWNEIKDNVILGAIPLNNYDHLNELKKEGVGYVLTVLDEFEMMSDTYLSVPVKPDDWKSNGVSQMVINSSDFSPIKLEDISMGAAFIEDSLKDIKQKQEQDMKSPGKVYVHCKSGHGRSAIMVIAHLMKYRAMNVNDAYMFVKARRSVISLNELQVGCLYDFYNSYCQKKSS